MEGKRTYKKEKVAEQIMNEMNSLMRTQLGDSRLTFVSITKVSLSKDMAFADVFWDTFDASKRGDAKKAIEASAGKFRKHLSKVLKMRHVPELRLAYDAQYEAEKVIDDLIKPVEDEDVPESDS